MIYPELWEKLERFDFSHVAPSRTFLKQLAEENGWSPEFSEKAVLEYKRFMYLSIISTEQLVPSDVVDQVWRLHLGRSRNYWGEFSKLLGKQIHHDYFSKDAHDVDMLSKQYLHTLRLYKDEFGGKSDHAYWPDVADRFAAAPNFVRVNLTDNLVLQKPTWALGRSAGRFAAVALFPLCVMGYAMNQSNTVGTGGLSNPGWMMVAGIAIVIATFGCLVWRMEFRQEKQKEVTPPKAERKRFLKNMTKPALDKAA